MPDRGDPPRLDGDVERPLAEPADHSGVSDYEVHDFDPTRGLGSVNHKPGPVSMSDISTFLRGLAPSTADAYVLQNGSIMEPFMSVNLSIKNAPDDLVALLKARAERNHRSMQGEVLAILEEAVRAPRRLTPMELLAEAKKLDLNMPSEAAEIVRKMRDERYGG
jgi:plasmid stability protein